MAGESQQQIPRAPAHAKIPLHRNPRVRAFAFQALALGFVVWALWAIFDNTITNLESRGIRTGFDFMGQVAPFGFPENFFPFWDFKLGESLYIDVFVIGVQNTILISVLGVISATFLGFTVGVLRLSPNWLVARLAGGYIEVFRNTPLLLQLLFWYFAVFLAILPPARESWSFGDAVFLNKPGLYLPRPIFDSIGAILFVGALVLAAALIVYMRKWARQRQDETGANFPTATVSILLVVVFAAVAFAIGWATGAISFELPEFKKFNYDGGIKFPFSAFVLWFALTVYTASFIAENVRGGIAAVSHGQTEAARALGLHRLPTLQLVVIPQAMRVIIPPTISQFLNLTKNSSLAVAIGYPDVVNVWAGISLNQTGQALVIIGITIAVYETLSLLTSAFLNWYNKKAQLQNR